jgi:hypothetical protein
MRPIPMSTMMCASAEWPAICSTRSSQRLAPAVPALIYFEGVSIIDGSDLMVVTTQMKNLGYYRQHKLLLLVVSDENCGPLMP